MSQGLVERQNLEDIADAIRSKNGSSDTYTPSEMAQAISAIHTIDEAVLVQKTVNANGQYNASDDSADGYSGVRVNVPNSYSASDEGKVVSNGDLVAQTTKQITANGTHDTTMNNSVAVDVPNSYAASDNGKVVINQALVAQTSKNINANGTHDTTANNSVVVDVPNSYGSADEGKVVSGGALIGQTSRNVTVNGTYDTTENNEVVVNVSGGGGDRHSAVKIWTKATGTGNASLYIQLGEVTGNSFIETSEAVSLLYSDAYSYIEYYDLIKIRYTNSYWNVYALKTVIYNNAEYGEDDLIVQWHYGTQQTSIIIRDYESGIFIVKQITQNGIYNASDDNVDGYKRVTVNVSGTSTDLKAFRVYTKSTGGYDASLYLQEGIYQYTAGEDVSVSFVPTREAESVVYSSVNSESIKTVKIFGKQIAVYYYGDWTVIALGKCYYNGQIYDTKETIHNWTYSSNVDIYIGEYSE